VAGRYPQQSATGDAARYRDATFGTVGGVAYDADTALIYLSESSSSSDGISAVRITEPSRPEQWEMTSLAGYLGAGGRNGALTGAQFREPTGLYFDQAERALYVVDTGNHAIRRIDSPTETVTTIVNKSHSLGKTGDGGPASEATALRCRLTSCQRRLSGRVSGCNCAPPTP
jgi:hypothetical protein